MGTGAAARSATCTPALITCMAAMAVGSTRVVLVDAVWLRSSPARERDVPVPRNAGKGGPVVVASTAWRKQLGEWLAKLREQAGVSTAEAAGRLGCVESTLRHWEAGRSAAKKIELEALLDLYEAPWDAREQLERIREDRAKWEWWASYRLPTCFAPDAGFEAEAAKICAFELALVPGLLQTETYARAVHRVGRHAHDTTAIEKSVAARLERQRRLIEEPRLQLRVVLAEEALFRGVGSEQVMQDQLDHVVAMVQRPNVIVQVLPFTAGAHVSPHGSFAVFSFADRNDEDIGFTDTPLGGHVIEDAADVTALRCLFDELRSMALPTSDSFELLQSMASHYHPPYE